MTTRYAYDMWNPAKAGAMGTSGSDIWAVLNGSSSLTSRELQGDGIDEHLAYTTSGSNAFWFLSDHLGSIRTVVDSTGATVHSYSYDAFGNVTSPSSPTMYAWTGCELDAETGMQYNRARYYDPATGRWISLDPMGFDAGDSNLYRYVNNRPGLDVDPSGLQDRELQGIRIVGSSFALDFFVDKKTTNTLDIISAGKKIATLRLYPNMEGYWEDGTYESRAFTLLLLRQPRYWFKGGITMVLVPQGDIDKNDFDFVQTLWARADINRSNKWSSVDVSIQSADDQRTIESSMTAQNPGKKYFVDADLDQTNPRYPAITQGNTRVFVDHPTTSIRLVNGVMALADAVGGSATVNFTTYITYKGSVVAFVRWSTTSTTYYSHWYASRSTNMHVRGLPVNVLDKNGDLATNPMEAGEMNEIKKRWPDQKLINF